MGRTIGSNGTSAAADAMIATIKTIDKVEIGNVVAIGASGKVGYVSPTNIAPNRTVDDPVSSSVTLPLGSTGYEQPRFNGHLSNHIIFDTGEEFLAYTGNGTNENTNAGFYNLSTGVKTVVTTNSGIYISALEKLNEDSFLYLTTMENYGSVQFSIMGKDGTTVIKALTVISTINAYGEMGVSSNGVDRIAIVYSKASGNYLTILDYSGNIIGTERQLSTSSNSSYTRVKFLANGNILVYYTKVGTGFFTKQFTVQGVAIGTELQLSNVSATTLLNSSSSRLIQSIGTNIYVLAFNSSSYVTLYKISDTNTLVSSATYNNQNAYAGDILITADGNVLVASIISNSVTFGLYTQNLVLIKSGYFGGSFAAVASNNITNNLFIAEFPNGYAVYTHGYSGSIWETKLTFNTPLFVTAGTALAIVSSSGSHIATSIKKHKGELYLLGAYSANTNYLCKRTLNAGKQSIIGVVTSSAEAGGDVSILIEGEAILSGNYSLIGAFDLRATVPYGNRGIIIGNKAVMFGIKV